jgi:hypothetical protein
MKPNGERKLKVDEAEKTAIASGLSGSEADDLVRKKRQLVAWTGSGMQTKTKRER